MNEKAMAYHNDTNRNTKFNHGRERDNKQTDNNRKKKTATNVKSFTFILSIFQLFDLHALFFSAAQIVNSLSNDLRKKLKSNFASCWF